MARHITDENSDMARFLEIYIIKKIKQVLVTKLNFKLIEYFQVFLTK